VEVAHLHGHGKSLQQATSAITDDCSDFPSLLLQLFNAALVRIDRLVRQELPEKVLLPVRTSPHHDTEESPEVRGVHDDDDLIGGKLLPLNVNRLELPLHPLRTVSVLLSDLRMGLLTVRVRMPEFLLSGGGLLPALLTAFAALPELLSIPCSILLDGT